MNDRDRDEGRRAGVIVSVSVVRGFLARRFMTARKHDPANSPETLEAKRHGRRVKVTATAIAQKLLDEGSEGEELLDAMWDWHDRTGIETRDIFQQYKTMQNRQPQTRPVRQSGIT